VDTETVLLHQHLPGQPFLFTAISPDGRTVAAASRSRDAPPTIRIFDVDTRRERTPLTTTELSGFLGLSFSPDGGRLLGMGLGRFGMNRTPSSKLVLWDLERGSQPTVVDAETDGRSQVATAGTRIAWAPDGSRFALSRRHGGDPAISVYDAATGKNLLTLDLPSTPEMPTAVPPSIASRTAFSTIWVATPTADPPYVAYSPDGKRIAGYVPARTTGDTPVLKVWDAQSGKEVLAIRLPPNENMLGMKRLTFSGDGHRLLLAEYGNGSPRSREPGSPPASTRAVLLTTWGATPVPPREPRTP
jgi:Tol biopolymer transport system component